MDPRRTGPRGFTLIELLVVMAIVATLLALVVPRYSQSVDHAREAALRHDLAVMRDAIDKHFADTGRYPASLQELAAKKYLRRIPVDPITRSPDTWVIVPPGGDREGGVHDVGSGAQGSALDGTPYSQW
ncbi:type II secretion system protein [Caldimonas tepidiphila]|uniref:type II secretion system protein n=1 Tax=Caldimonas tepidiphila TaxID=2315841 RepID=UPI000E5B04DE|nr:prepilin-type N-terminal cleavage/methylation domain-containing protein [Caldimonas tepidiphila]